MIHSVFSTDERFKRLDLGPGLNVLLAERRPEAADTDTRNGAGKSSLVSLIHFVLGGTVGKKSIFASDALKPFSFGLELDLGDERLRVTRNGGAPSTIETATVSADETLDSEDGGTAAPGDEVESGDATGDADGGEDVDDIESAGQDVVVEELASASNATEDPSAAPESDQADTATDDSSSEVTSVPPEVQVLELPGFEAGPIPERIRATEWPSVLREIWYPDLPDDHGPSTRTLLTFAARQATGGGFDDPFKIMTVQSAGESQVAVSYLLGLDWRLAEAWLDVRKRETSVRALTKALKDGELKSFAVGSVARLRTQVTLAERRVADLRQSASTFQVIPSFGELELEASRLSRDIRERVDDNAIDRAALDQLRETYEAEAPPAADDVASMYEAAGIQLGDLVRRRFEEVADFHASVVANRAHHLEQEISLVESRIAERELANLDADRRRAELLSTLRAGGALETLTALQAQLATEQAQLERLRALYQTADELETGRADAKQARQTLHVQLRQDLRERDDQLTHVIGRFEEFSTRLYDERVGSLEVDATDNGPTFDVEIHGGTSTGISRMQVFCFDLLAAEMASERGVGPGFLVHDSHLFDGVDERQIGRGLALAAEVAEAAGFQYIVTMNSDDMPTTVPDGFDLDQHVLPVVLTDADDDGGLFGFRFDSADPELLAEMPDADSSP